MKGILKKFLLIVFCCGPLFSPKIRAQSQRLTLKARNVTVGQVLKMIEQKTNYLFIIKGDVHELMNKVNVHEENSMVKDVLDEIFKNTGIVYRQENNNILIMEQKNDRKTSNAAPPVKKPIYGAIKDETGEPLIGANVMLKGSTVGTTTDIDGKFTINAFEKAVLVVSYIGFTDTEVRVGNKNNLQITLLSDRNMLDNVVVVGYGTQKKENLTGAVDQVGSETFEGRPNANLKQMLQGQIPNVNLKFTDGRPNSSPSFNIRGTTSIGQGGHALVIIDGVQGDASMLNPNDIESVSVLKDASSAAVYGSRAPYGVILITTKTAKEDKPKITYETNLSFEAPTTIPNYVSDGYTYAKHFYDAFYSYNRSIPSSINKTMEFSTSWLSEYKKRAESGNFETTVSDGSIGTEGRWLYYHEGTDYMDKLYKDFMFSQTHNLSLSGADKRSDYYASARYYGNNGIFDSDVNPESYKIINGRIKIGYKITPWLKLSNNTDITLSKYIMPQTYSEHYGNIWRNIGGEGHPCSPIWNPDGTLTHSAVYSIGDFLYGKSNRMYGKRHLRTTTSAQAKFFNDKLKINADFTYRNKDYNTTIKKVKTPFSRYEGIIETIAGTQSYISRTLKSDQYLANNEYLEYEDKFNGKHYFKVLVGYNYEQETHDKILASNEDLLSPDADNINVAVGVDTRKIEGDYYKWRNVGAFTRINYSYDNRYLIEFNGRYDGSSKFPPRQRWAFFPSVSIGWRLTKEPWFKVGRQAITSMKLRASYGELGNNSVNTYAYDETFSFKNGRVIDGALIRYTDVPSPIPESLTWETARTFDVGLDMSSFNGRLSFTGDYYSRKTLNMYAVGPTLPDVYGAASPKGNFAEMTTRGYELTLNWNDSFNLAGKPFEYGIKASLADYKSVIDKFNNATRSLSKNSYNSNYYEGMVIGEIWGFISKGLWQNQEDIDIAEAGALAAGQKYYNPLMQTSKTYKLYPGDIKFEDLNHNGYIDRGSNTVDNPGDRRIIGNYEPRYLYGFGVNFKWHDFFFNAFFQGVGKQDWYPSKESIVIWGQYIRPYAQIPSWHIGNYWTEDNPDAYLPRYTGAYGPFKKGDENANSRYLMDVSYIRLKNLQFGYTLPKKWTDAVHIRKSSVFFSGENLWSWSPMYKYTRDIDVTANIYGTDSVLQTEGDGYNYPTMRTFSLGINVTF